MRVFALAVLAALLAPASLVAAQGLAPLGQSEVAGAELHGEPLTVRYDPGASPLPGDDHVAVDQGVRGASVRWTGAPLDTSAEAGLRGLEVHLGALPFAGEQLAQAGRQARPVSDLAWPIVEPRGVNAHLQVGPVRHDESKFAIITWPARWSELGWGLDDDGVSFPTAVVEDTDLLLSTELRIALYACRETGEVLGQPLPGCDPALAAAFLGALPRGVVRSELQKASLQVARTSLATLTPSFERAFALASPGSPAAARGVAPPVAAAPGPQVPGLAAVALAASGHKGDAVIHGPGAQAQGAGVVAALLNPALPLALAALALLAPVWALYRRILPSGVLGHPVREDILRRVRLHPGIHESLLAREMGLRHTHVQYHLRVLAEAGILEVRRFGGLKCIFERGRHTAGEKALAMSERGRSQGVLLAVSAEPGIAQRDIARRLGMSESSVKWHLDRLAGCGFVTTERARGAKRAWPVPGVLSPAVPAPLAAVPEPAPPAPRPEATQRVLPAA